MHATHILRETERGWDINKAGGSLYSWEMEGWKENNGETVGEKSKVDFFLVMLQPD